MVPLLLTLVFGVIFFSQWFKSKAIVQVAAREGARVFAVTGDAGRARAQAERELLAAGIRLDDVDARFEASGFSRRAVVILERKLSMPLVEETYRIRGEAVFNAE